jgi:UPF0755 protein
MKRDEPKPATSAADASPTGARHLRPLWWFVAVLGVVFIFFVAYIFLFLTSPATERSETVIIDFPVGTPLSALSDILEQQGVVRSSFKFRFYARLSGEARHIKAGEYEFSTALRPDAVLSKLVRGEVVLHQVTFPEGVTAQDMAALLAAQGLARADQVLAMATDADFAKDLGISAPTLEGYLFARHLPVATILRTMVGRFLQYFGAAQEERARHLGLTRHEVVILASVVEKETGFAPERPLIAGVFLNRLRRRIPLQSDPTVIYGTPDFDGNLTRAHLIADTPYNTYTRLGLPAGPICNPGAAALDAVLSPATTSYLYFVGKGDGTHQFSVTLPEHNAAVARYQLHR